MGWLSRLFTPRYNCADFRLAASSGIVQIKNILPDCFPGLFIASDDTTAPQEDILTDITRLTGEFWGGALPPRQLKVFLQNIQTLLDIDIVRRLLGQLRAAGMQRYYQRDVILAALFQLCTSEGRSKSARDMRDNLQLVLLGACLRHLEAPFLPKEARAVLQSRADFNLLDSREVLQRNRLLEQIRQIEENILAQKGLGRFLNFSAAEPKNPPSWVTAAVIRHSGRLTGRTASTYPQEVLWKIPREVFYLEILDSVAAAWARERKPPLQVFAEEYTRMLISSRHRTSGELISRCCDALEDLRLVFGIEILPNFQGLGTDAFYQPAGHLLARAAIHYAEPHREEGQAFRRFASCRQKIESARQQSLRLRKGRDKCRDIPVLTPEFLEEADRETTDQSQVGADTTLLTENISWKCFTTATPIPLKKRRELEWENKGTLVDPPDSALRPYLPAGIKDKG